MAGEKVCGDCIASPQVVDWVGVTKISLKSGRGGVGDKLVSLHDQNGDEEKEREIKDKHIPV